jgi:hypothetical protein
MRPAELARSFDPNARQVGPTSSFGAIHAASSKVGQHNPRTNTEVFDRGR